MNKRQKRTFLIGLAVFLLVTLFMVPYGYRGNGVWTNLGYYALLAPPEFGEIAGTNFLIQVFIVVAVTAAIIFIQRES